MPKASDHTCYGREQHSGSSKQLDDDKEGEMALLSKHKEVESELAAAREHLQQQASDLVLKASHIGMLQAIQMTHNVTIKDLESEKSRANERLSQLEEERAFLQSKTQSLDEEQKQQILELEKKVNEAKKTQQEYYKMELKNLQSILEGEVAQLNEAHSKTLEELGWKHHMAIEAVHSNAIRDKKKLQMELEEQYKKEILNLEGDKNQLQQELEHLKEELEDKLNTANQKIGHLQDLERLQMNLTKGRLKDTKDALLNVEGELQQERQQYEETLTAMKEEEKLRVDKMAQDLEIKWTENLRQECSKLHEELRLQHEEDKKSTMSQLLQLKKREKNAEEKLQSLKDAHRESMEGFRIEMEQELQALRFELEDEGKAMLASLCSELNHQHAAAIDLLRHSHHQGLAAAKMELEVQTSAEERQRKNDKSSSNRFVSVRNMSVLKSGGVGNGHPNCLDPIPNSPVHDTEFNSSKPEPQAGPPKEPKTFLSPPQSEASLVASPNPQHQEWFAQ
ncbi:hypothetical protein MC885_002868 [Smutsia gigantea]|nr:hypothetical protein MC885_002868 [Smutsia gigantea]